MSSDRYEKVQDDSPLLPPGHREDRERYQKITTPAPLPCHGPEVPHAQSLSSSVGQEAGPEQSTRTKVAAVKKEKDEQFRQLMNKLRKANGAGEPYDMAVVFKQLRDQFKQRMEFKMFCSDIQMRGCENAKQRFRDMMEIITVL